MSFLVKEEWRDVSDLVRNASPDAHRILDRVAGKIGRSNAQVFKVEASYGDLILNNGRFVCEGLPETSEKSWQGLPLGLVVQGSAEVFLPAGADGHSFPLRVLRSGEFFGVWESLTRVTGQLDPEVSAPWSMTSGIRTLYIVAPMDRLPFRAEVAQLLRKAEDDHLCRLGAQIDADNRNTKQSDRKLSPAMFAWELIRLLGASEPWTATFLLFPDKWLLDSEKKVVLDLLLYLQNLRWEQSELLREEGRLLMEISGCCAAKGSLVGAADVTTPAVLTLIENVYRQRAFAFALTDEVVDDADQELGPLRGASQALARMLRDVRVETRPLFALLTNDDSRPRYLPLGLPMLRLPTKTARGWPKYFNDLGCFLKTCDGDLEGIFSTPLKMIDFLVQQMGNMGDRTQRRKLQLPTRSGQLVSVDCDSIGNLFPELSGKLNVRSRFFLGCVRIAARSEGEILRA